MRNIWGLYCSGFGEEKLYAKMKKCEFSKSKVKYLGHVVGYGTNCR